MRAGYGLFGDSDSHEYVLVVQVQRDTRMEAFLFRRALLQQVSVVNAILIVSGIRNVISVSSFQLQTHTGRAAIKKGNPYHNAKASAFCLLRHLV